jgi:SNF2 family DNA or RNA helicase
MTDGRVIEISVRPGGTTVELERGPSVEDAVWLQVRADFGSLTKDASHRLVAPLEALLLRRKALGAITRRNDVGVVLDEELRQLIGRANTDGKLLDKALGDQSPSEAVEVDSRLTGGRFLRKLRPFQVRDLGHLLALAHGANFSVPGAGKTTVTYALYEAERLAGRIEKMLVIAPLSAFGAWLDEAEDCFEPDLVVRRFDGQSIPSETEVLLINYQRLNNNFDLLAEWVTEHPTMIILDEAHRMKKGWGGQWGTACLNLAYLGTRRDILTGTPAPQAPKDLVALLDFLWPGRARSILPKDALGGNPPIGVGKEVSTAIAPLFVRTTKGDLALPEVKRIPIVVPLEGLHREIYMALRSRYNGLYKLTQAGEADMRRMGRVVMYMLEAATNPKLLTSGSDKADPDVFWHEPLEIPEESSLTELLADYNRYHRSAKFVELERILKENADQGRKTLVWSNFVRNLKLLKTDLALLQPALIHGGVPAFAPEGEVSRETEIKRFREDDDCLVLLANPAAMSEGISLHRECHDAVYLERTFNAGQYLQSIDRIHRLGLPPDTETRITFLMTDETVDLAVNDRVRTKAETLGEMLSDPGIVSVALPDDEDYGPPIDQDLDVDALFRHLRGEDAG